MWTSVEFIIIFLFSDCSLNKLTCAIEISSKVTNPIVFIIVGSKYYAVIFFSADFTHSSTDAIYGDISRTKEVYKKVKTGKQSKQTKNKSPFTHQTPQTDGQRDAACLELI